jgi:hypothetical protein
MPLEPLQTQIPPSRINRNNQPNLLNPEPMFDYSLALNRIPHILKTLEVNQPIDSLLSRKPGTRPRFVLPNPPHQIIRNARVKRLRPIRHDVNKVHRSGSKYTGASLRSA